MMYMPTLAILVYSLCMANCCILFCVIDPFSLHVKSTFSHWVFITPISSQCVIVIQEVTLVDIKGIPYVAI